MLKLGYYIYAHIRPDTNEIFYIGKGTKYDSKYKEHAYKRAYSRKRNPHWMNIVNKNNGKFKVKILNERKTKDSINRLEQKYIKRLGRIDSTLFGCLVNMTDGGDGGLNMVCKPETREKLRKRFSSKGHPNYGKKLSDETCRRKSESMKASPKNLKGKELPEWWRDKIRQTKIGEDNPMYGKRGQETPNARMVIDLYTGIYFESTTEAANVYGYKMKTLYNWLTGHRKPNPTNLKFI